MKKMGKSHMKDTKKKKYLLAKSARQFSLIVFLVGVLGVIAAAYYAEAFTPKAGTISSACASGLTTISVALIGYAIFSLTFDTKHWRDYFAERLKEVILEQDRSEEHTSELQSHLNLVCRLL